jgi:UDP-glucose 4-epimerase
MVVFGDGAQTRDFTYVSDTARGIVLAGTSESAIGQTINLGRGREVTINDLARLVAEVTGGRGAVERVEDRPGDVLRLHADMSRARALLGYQPQVTLEDGLRRLLEWYRGQPQSPDELLGDEVVRNWQAAG